MGTAKDTLWTPQVLHTPRLALDVQAFLLDAQARNLAAGTLYYYEHKLYPLVEYLGSQNVRQSEDVTPALLRQWLVHLQDTDHNPGGVHGFYRAAKAFFAWLVREGTLTSSPMLRVKAPKVPLEQLQPVTTEQIKAMLAVCDPKTEVGARDRAVMLCLWDSGCRASEFIALSVGDLTMVTGALLVRSGKGSKPRVTFLGAKSRRELLRYLRFRGDVDPTAPLFASKEGERLAYESLRDIVRRRAKDAGITAPTLHAFRRAFALDSLRNGADVYSLQKMMGHADLSVLRRYLAQTQGDLQAAHEKSGPVDHLL